MIDYRELLVKYMRHVAYEEGETFLYVSEDGFTEEELAELKRLDRERGSGPSRITWRA